jgi:hypothetical protein
MISDPKLPPAHDVLSKDVLSKDVLSKDVLSKDVLAKDVASVEPVLPPESATQALGASVPDSVSGPKPTPSRARLWLRRIGFLLFVFLCATVGVMLVILPWRPEWSENPLLLSYPTLRAVVASGFARGVSTGLGVLNVWIGFWEAIKYQED